MITIKNRYGETIFFTGGAETMQQAVLAAVAADVDLSFANLSGANLSRIVLSGANLVLADLSGANLFEADLTDAALSGASLSRAVLVGADLSCADLSRANLRDANLLRADLSGANLFHADLYRANLYGASLSRAALNGANLSYANLYNASLSGANLEHVDLTVVRDDLWAILSAAPAEVRGVLDALLQGRVDGSTYTGECACLVGTIANLRNEEYHSLVTLQPDAGRPAEMWFAAIERGDTPANNVHARLAFIWIEQWLHNVQMAFDPVYRATYQATTGDVDVLEGGVR